MLALRAPPVNRPCANTLALPQARGRRAFAVAVFAKKDHHDHSSSHELQAYTEREKMLFAELVAVRSQVDKLLDQQQVLLAMVARLTTPAAAPAQTGAWPQGPAVSYAASSPAAAPAPAAPASPGPASSSSASSPFRPSSAKASSSSGSSSALSTSTDVPAPSSLADFFRNSPPAPTHPTVASAAASVAAALAAVDTEDILSLSSIPTPPTPTTPVSPPPPTPSSASSAPSSSGSSSSSSASKGAAAEGLFAVGTAGAGGSTGDKQEAADGYPVEVNKAAPTDPPPDLVQGDDDIFWMSRLHAELEAQGYWPGDEDVDNWYFGEGTHNAVLAFQASVKLPETGVVDRPTWVELLGQEEAARLFAAADAAAAAAAEGHGLASAQRVGVGHGSGDRKVELAADRWPVLMEGDGGRAVHALQVCLDNAGFHCGEDDMRWWQFGDATLNALKYFQSSVSLPESGVCDERSWLALLGPEALPADLLRVRLAGGDDSGAEGFDEDMEEASQGRVWLLGEQRWEKKK